MIKLVINEDNFKYLVTKTISTYKVTLLCGYPRKSKKGYVGINWKNEEKKFANKDDALLQFANWREDYLGKFYKGEIADLRIWYAPFIDYLVTCPVCGKDAEIITWMGTIGWGSEEYGVHKICCKHCAKSQNFMDVLDNEVGIVTFCLMNNEEEQCLRLQHHMGIKWEEYLEKGFYKDKK